MSNITIILYNIKTRSVSVAVARCTARDTSLYGGDQRARVRERRRDNGAKVQTLAAAAVRDGSLSED